MIYNLLAGITRSIVHDEIIGLPSGDRKRRIPVLPTAGGGTKA